MDMTVKDRPINVAEVLSDSIQNRSLVVGVMGLGYVGLPLFLASAGAGFTVVGFDTDRTKVELISNGRSYIDSVDQRELGRWVSRGLASATTDFSRLAECDIICVCVPTPLTPQREPDLKYVQATARAISKSLRPHQVIILESTTYPGTTDDVVKPLLERRGLKSGVDFYLGYSPEREDPGNANFNTRNIPKIVSGDGETALQLIQQFYGAVVQRTVPVRNIKTAEVVKLTENIFRAVNIGLVNELKTIYAAMGIDIWDVIEAAKTKPFGYMPFYPGPGLGGHCIPVDPFYLTWKSREYSLPTRFIELAGEVNSSMPYHVVRSLSHALDERLSLPLGRSSVLVAGVAYKKNVNDTRESPAFKIMELLEGRVADLAFHDSHVSTLGKIRNHPGLSGLKSIPLTAESISAYDAILLVTDHDDLDYGLMAKHARLVIDTRNAFGARKITNPNIVKA